ncbi:MAG TPA: DNA/RNA non-specific endonuclease [Chthonomonadaceae bacterium]|nr:DNA/RNA non-specific endonuclease [Chthonomonadaceae bacterium]
MLRLSWMRSIALGFSLTFILAVLTSGADTDPNAQMLLGNPDNATTSPDNRLHYLIKRGQYAISYNNTLHIPNWVGWHLNASDLGTQKGGTFRPDTNLPAGFTRVATGDYTNSGYDLGQGCPSADRSADRRDNDAVFLMTNVVPLAPGLNAGPWGKLESFCRNKAKQGNELYILCGYGFIAPTHPLIGKPHIAVPDFVWKIVVILPDKPGDDLKRMTNQARVIAVMIPNNNKVANQNWTDFLVTTMDIEQVTELTFFKALPLTTTMTLKAVKDSGKP